MDVKMNKIVYNYQILKPIYILLLHTISTHLKCSFYKINKMLYIRISSQLFTKSYLKNTHKQL